MLSFLRCLISGHDYEEQSTKTRRYEQCQRCGRIRNKELTYYGEAEQYLKREHMHDIYEPVESITDESGRVMESGDRVRIRETNSAFPGLHFGKSHTVQYLFKTPHGTTRIKLEWKRHLIPEHRVMGIQTTSKNRSKP